MSQSDFLFGLVFITIIISILGALYSRIQRLRALKHIIVGMKHTKEINVQNFQKSQNLLLFLIFSSLFIAGFQLLMKASPIYTLFTFLHCFTYLLVFLQNRRIWTLPIDKLTQFYERLKHVARFTFFFMGILIILANLWIEIAQRYLLLYLFIILCTIWMILGVSYWLFHTVKSESRKAAHISGK